MISEARSIVEMSRGAILERLDYETARVMDNIMDPNTKPDAKRTITLKLEFKQDKNRQMIQVEATAKSSLAKASASACTPALRPAGSWQSRCKMMYRAKQMYLAKKNPNA